MLLVDVQSKEMSSLKVHEVPLEMPRQGWTACSAGRRRSWGNPQGFSGRPDSLGLAMRGAEHVNDTAFADTC